MRAFQQFDRHEFQQRVALLTRKLGEIAQRAGVMDTEFGDLERVLFALPLTSRRRARLMLQGIYVQSSNDCPGMGAAIQYIQNLADEIWNRPTPKTSAGAIYDRAPR